MVAESLPRHCGHRLLSSRNAEVCTMLVMWFCRGNWTILLNSLAVSSVMETFSFVYIESSSYAFGKGTNLKPKYSSYI